MASLQMMKPNLSAFPSSRFRDISFFSFSEFDFEAHGKRIIRLKQQKRRVSSFGKLNRVCCKLQDGDSPSKSGDEPPESLFMKELRRRGITPTSLLEETSRSTVDEDIEEKGGDRSFSQRNTVATDKSLTNQREQSMALNSEGLEGLIPRGKVLLTLGGTFFLAFWPLILITIASFAALYLYFGPTFVHDGSRTPIAPPQYIDPYVLLQEERITQ